MFDIGKLIQDYMGLPTGIGFSSMLDIGKLIQSRQKRRALSGFSSMLDIGKLILKYRLVSSRSLRWRAAFNGIRGRACSRFVYGSIAIYTEAKGSFLFYGNAMMADVFQKSPVGRGFFDGLFSLLV